MARRADRAPLTAKRKALFLSELARHGIAVKAARVASPESLTGALATFKDERRRDPKFAAAWDEAIEAADGDLLAELHRRAVEGVPTDVRGPNGQVIGQYRRVSDRLLVEKLRSRFPREFAAHTVSEVTAKVSNVPIGLDQLTPENQERLRAILESQQRLALEAPSESHSSEEREA
jgi:hypothetical protein